MLSTCICAALSGCVAASTASGGPIVDLGYGLWQSTINTTGNYYNFSNIRYGQAPVGDLRFAAPLKPLSNRSAVNDGQDGRICIQGYPSWSKERSLFVKQYVEEPNNISAFNNIPPPGINVTAKPLPQQDGRATEDCLFLDVLVPQQAYHNSSLNATGGVPVHVWLYGGGFYEGWKDSQGNAAGFLLQSMRNAATAPGVIFVALNYRLGAFGWLSGPTFAASGGLPNAGLYDQRLALEWIQDHIHLFGGNSQKVTLMGESAGASSTLHHITAYGGSQGNASFQQAVLISPAFNPNPYNIVQEQTYQKFLAAANVSTLTELRNASSETVIRANSLTVWQATYGGSGGYGPVVDGNIAPALPIQLLQQGRFAMNVQAVLAGHNSDEGLIFTNPALQNDTAFNVLVNSTNSLLFPDAQPSIKSMIAGTLYPPANATTAKSLGYNDTISRFATMIGDLTLNCNMQQLLTTFNVNKTHGWLLSTGAGLHGEDTPYMFYNNGPMADVYGFGVVNATVATTMQNWILTFGATGTPNGAGYPRMPVYGANHTLASLSDAGVGRPVADNALAQRCNFWKQALYY